MAHMSLKTVRRVHKSALRADLDAEDRKTLAEDRKRMERLGKGSQLDDWLAFGPGLLIRRRLAKNIAGLAETDPAKGHRYSRAFKEQLEMDGLYDRTTKSDVMKSTFTAVLWFYDDEKLEERRREILEEIRRDMTPGQRARFNSPISAQQRVLDELRTRGLAPAKKPRAQKPANDLDQANARIVELEEELKSARSIAPVTDIAEHAAELTDPVVTTVNLQAYLEKRVNADGPSIPSTGSPSSADPALDPRAWSMSTPQEREAFVKTVGRSEIEGALNAIESGWRLTRGLNSLNQAWKAATEPDRRTFCRQYYEEMNRLGWQQKW
jgi:hypothetical protein